MFILIYAGCASPESSETARQPTDRHREGDVLVTIRPSTPEKFAKENGESMVRQVDVVMLGKVEAITGVVWSTDPDGKKAYATSVSEPCDVTIHVGEEVLRIKTRPILVISQVNDTVTSMYVPPASSKGSMREKVDEVYRILSGWKAEPNDRMRQTLDDWREHDYTGGAPDRIVPNMRAAWATLDDTCTVSVRFSSGPDGGWQTVMELQTTDAQRDRARRKASAN